MRRNNINIKGGFIGIFALLISVLIIAVFVSKIYFFNSNTKVGDENNEDSAERLNVSGQLDVIEKAKNARSLLEENNRKILMEDPN